MFEIDLLTISFILYSIIVFSITFTRNFLGLFGVATLCIISSGFLFLTTLYTFDTIVFLQQSVSVDFTSFVGLQINDEFNLNFNLDILAYFFVLLVIMIGFCTNIYILNYFKYEPYEDIFYILINWFIFSMLFLVLANNAFTLYLGWELIGITSFFLINFWSQKMSTLKAGFKAFSFNKFSDCCLLVFIVIFMDQLHSTNILFFNSLLNSNLIAYSWDLKFATIFLIICASIKSAQFIGHLWLPDSMEAPVPASALIHSATLVSAGVYLLLRFTLLLDLVNLLNVLTYIGSFTAAYGGIVAAAQTDVKKLLAYSTISHCGFLFVCVGLNESFVTILYLYLHGIFKAATFFCVGSLIRIANSQDTRQMGILHNVSPVDSILLLICVINLGGLPFTFGYLYKSFFLATLIHYNTSIFVVGMSFIGLLSSLVYVFRLVYYSLFDFNKSQVNKTQILLQEVKETKLFWTLTTFVHIIAVTILLCSFFYLYIFFFTNFYEIAIHIEQVPLDLVPNNIDVEFIEKHYKQYYIVYYTLFIIIWFSLVIFTNRWSFNDLYKFNFLQFLIFSLYLLSVLNFLQVN